MLFNKLDLTCMYALSKLLIKHRKNAKIQQTFLLRFALMHNRFTFFPVMYSCLPIKLISTVLISSVAALDCNVNVNVSHILGWLKWRKLLHGPRKRSVIKGQCQYCC